MSAQPNALAILRNEVTRMTGEFERALPENVTAEKFVRVVLNAIMANPAFVECDRTSFFSAAMKCAADGLLPDSREAVMIPYKGIVQYQPMVGGIYKKARNSGEIAILCADLVHPQDQFQYGTNSERGRYLDHIPKFSIERKVEEISLVYGLSKTKDGDVDFEVMSRQEIEYVRSKSKAPNSPAWREWWGEMAKKTVIKRLAKRLPTSSDLQSILKHDNEEYDLSQSVPKSKSEQLQEKLSSDFASFTDAPPVGDPALVAGSNDDQKLVK